MNTVNYGDQLSHRLTLRLNDNQFSFLVRVSNLLGITPSDYIRMAINSSMTIASEKTPAFFDSDSLKVGGTPYENVKTDINNQL